MHKAGYQQHGFTIVELLVVIVVIGILAAITVVVYTGISQKAIVASLQSDLTNSVPRLKMYQVEHGTYPQDLVGNCPTGPADTNYCLKPSSGNTLAYSSSSPYSSFTLTATNTNGTSYQITDSSGPVASTTGVGGVYAYTYRKTVTIDTTATGANIGALTDFPICVVVNSSSWTNATERGHFFNDTYNPLGKRVQFFDADGTTNLAYEVESYDGSGQTAVYWVKVPQIDGASTTDHIHVGYGSDPNTANQEQKTSVWDSNFAGVWHFKNGSGSTTPDSTVNNHPVTWSGTYSQGATGVATNAGKGAIANIGLGLTSQAKTLETWDYIDPATGTNRRYLLGSGSGGNPAGYSQNYLGAGDSSNVLLMDIGQSQYWSIDQYSGTYTTGAAWHHYAGTANGTNATNAYVDGVASATNTTTYSTAGTSSDRWAIGAPWSGGGSWGAYSQAFTVGEARVSRVVRTADWLKATYFSLKATSWNGDGWLIWSGEQAN